MFDELLERLTDLEVSGEPEYLQSNFIHGIKRMPVTVTPTSPLGRRSQVHRHAHAHRLVVGGAIVA